MYILLIRKGFSHAEYIIALRYKPQNVSYSPKYTVKKWGWLNPKNVISVATHLYSGTANVPDWRTFTHAGSIWPLTPVFADLKSIPCIVLAHFFLCQVLSWLRVTSPADQGSSNTWHLKFKLVSAQVGQGLGLGKVNRISGAIYSN